MIHLLYHANCADGFAAACLARHALLDGKPSAPGHLRLHPVGYDSPMPVTRENTGVLDRFIFVDFTPPEDWLAEMTDHPKFIDAANCTIIDHHKTKAPIHANLGSKLFTSVFDTTHSGATLTWRHFYASALSRPHSLTLLRHYDLGGVWDDPQNHLTNGARWLVAYLMRCLPRTPEAWTPVLLEYDLHIDTALNRGAILWNKDLRAIRTFAKHPHWVHIGGFDVPALNGIPYGLLNDALAELLTEHPNIHFAAAWSVLSDTDTGGVIKWSLRSRKGGFDCAAFCQTLSPGGGGHPQAAGFSTLDPVQFV